MSVHKWLLCLIIVQTLFPAHLFAQDVVIPVPAATIINRMQYSIEAPVMNTQGHTRFGTTEPAMRALGRAVYQQEATQNTLSSGVLRWQLAAIGTKRKPLTGGGIWPVEKWFTTTDQQWYHPVPGTTFPAGNVTFLFRMLPDPILNNAFRAGDYSMQVVQNYGASSPGTVHFTPETFKIILSIPPFITWISSQPGVVATVSSLNDFRPTATDLSIDLGTKEIANSLDFRFWANATSPNMQFTSSRNVSTLKPIPPITLKSTQPTITPQTVTSTPKELTANSECKVVSGNRHTIPLTANITPQDLKNHFFEAGTYQLKLKLEARNTQNNILQPQETEVVLKVLPLSEITVAPLASNVHFDFNTAEKYQAGETKVASGQVRISNNEPFELYVKADRAYFSNSPQLPATTLQVGVDGNTPLVPLSTTPQKIISNGTPVLDKDLDIKYVISPAAAQSLVPLEKNTYSINVIYSFTAL